MLVAFPQKSAGEVPGQVSYSLPKTTVVFDVTVRKTEFTAGPYAKWAKKYLGYEVEQKNRNSVEISAIDIKSLTEADFGARYSIQIPASGLPVFAQLSAQGLVVCDVQEAQRSSSWRFPAAGSDIYANAIMPANLAEQTNTLRTSGDGSVRQSVLVEKNTETKAKEAADMIFKIRSNRYRILVGDTDATYSGEAMKSAVDALEKLEKEYLSLFVGQSVALEQKASFELTPVPGPEQMYVAFRLSDNEGLVSPDNVSGKPYYLTLTPEPIAEPTVYGKPSKPAASIIYRIPAICGVTLSDGLGNILQTRIPVYQLGKECTYPIMK